MKLLSITVADNRLLDNRCTLPVSPLNSRKCLDLRAFPLPTYITTPFSTIRLPHNSLFMENVYWYSEATDVEL